MFSGRFVIRTAMFAVLAAMCGIVPAMVYAADPVVKEQVPEPPADQRGIWGAIAFSPVSNEYGFFWGADKRNEAEDVAVKYCKNKTAAGCRLVITFRNHRHWTDDDGSGFPYDRCAALSVAEDKEHKATHWGAASGKTQKDAVDAATKTCGNSSACNIREWVCT